VVVSRELTPTSGALIRCTAAKHRRCCERPDETWSVDYIAVDICVSVIKTW